MLQSYENFYYNPSGFAANYERNWGWRHSVCYLLPIISLSSSMKLAKKLKRKHLCNIICAYSFGICFRVKHRSKNANKIAWNVLVVVFDMYCQRPGNLEGFIKIKQHSMSAHRTLVFCRVIHLLRCGCVSMTLSIRDRPQLASTPCRTCLSLTAVITSLRCH